MPLWIFDICLKRKFRLPLYTTTDTPFRPCGRQVDQFGDHAFQCTRICKIGVHNSIRDSLGPILSPALSTAGYLLPTSNFDVEPMLYLPSDPNARPFDISFNPDPALPPNVTHASPYTSIGADITISGPPPRPTFNHNSPDVIKFSMANADMHLQVYERRKLNRVNRRDPDTGIIAHGDSIIGDIYNDNMALLLFAINPFGRLGPILHHFLFNKHPDVPHWFPPTKPNATAIYSRIMTFPSPKEILKLADHNWRSTRPRQFFGHSYLSPTPAIHTLQELGLCLAKSFSAHNICYLHVNFQ
jgi:hypothetical protein